MGLRGLVRYVVGSTAAVQIWGAISWGTAVTLGGLVPSSWLQVVSIGGFVLTEGLFKAGVLVVGLVGNGMVMRWQAEQANAATTSGLSRELEKQRRQLCELNIFEMLRTIAKLTGKSELRTRSNLFLPGQDGKLHIVFSHNMESAPDLGVSLDKYQGCSGHAWATGKQAVANLSEATEGDLQLTWKLMPDQIKLTEDLGSIIATPVRHPYNEERIIGVLSVDSTGTMAESELDSEETQDECLQAARAVGKLLYLGGFVNDQGG